MKKIWLTIILSVLMFLVTTTAYAQEKAPKRRVGLVCATPGAQTALLKYVFTYPEITLAKAIRTINQSNARAECAYRMITFTYGQIVGHITHFDGVYFIQKLHVQKFCDMLYCLSLRGTIDRYEAFVVPMYGIPI